MKEDVRAAAILFFGFVAGSAAVAWLVLTDPEVRMIYNGKSKRMKDAGWTGIARECARATVLELRDAFPKLRLDGLDG